MGEKIENPKKRRVHVHDGICVGSIVSAGYRLQRFSHTCNMNGFCVSCDVWHLCRVCYVLAIGAVFLFNMFEIRRRKNTIYFAVTACMYFEL